MRWSIKTALTLTFVLLASLPLLGSGYFAMNYLSTHMEKEISDKNLLLATSYAREIERFLDQSSRRLYNMAHLLESGSLISPENLNRYLELAVSSYPDLELVRVLDSTGIVISLAPFDRNIFGLDMSRQAYCISASQQQPALWSNVFISPQTGASTLVLAIPFKGGMLVGHLSLSSVREIIDSINIGPGALVAVVDNNGTAIAHHNQSLVSQRSNLSNHEHIVQGLAGNEGNFRYRVNKQKRIGSIARVHGADWVVAVSQSLDEIFLPINNLKYIIFLAAMVAVFIAVLAAILSLNRILSPLKNITQNARRIERGDYSIKSIKASFTEIIDLEKSFKSMINEVKDREASLVESEEKFRSLMQQSPQSIQIFNTDGQLLQVNEAFKTLWGIPEELLPEIIAKYNVLKDNEVKELGILPAIEKAFNGEAVILPVIEYDAAAEIKNIGVSGSTGNKRWVQAYFYPIKNADGDIANVVGIEEDITERKKAETLLKQSEENRRALIDQTPLAIEIHSVDGRFLMSNPAYSRLAGLDGAELKAVHDSFDLRQDQHYQSMGFGPLLERLYSGEAVEFPVYEYNVSEEAAGLGITIPDKGSLWLSSIGFPLKDHNGRTEAVVLMSHDITERKLSEAKLREMHEFTDHLIQTANVMIIGLDQKGKLTHFNPAAEAITGYTFAEIEGKKWFDIFTPINKYPAVHEEFNRLLKGGVPKYFENPILTKNGEERFISWTNSEIRQQETIVGTISFGMDVTERKLSEQKLQEYQQRLKSLVSQLTVAEERERRNIAADLHDNVGQSLALSRMQIAVLQKNIKDTENLNSLDEISATLKQAIRDTRELVFDLSSPLMNEIGLSDAVADWLEEKIEKRHGIKTRLIVKGDKKRLDDDLRAILFRNIRELLTNAVKHAQASDVKVQFEFTDKFLMIMVSDNGIGYDAAAEMQKSNREKGFGLFSIEERMMDLGGSLEIGSEPGKGATAVLKVPRG